MAEGRRRVAILVGLLPTTTGSIFASEIGLEWSGSFGDRVALDTGWQCGEREGQGAAEPMASVLVASDDIAAVGPAVAPTYGCDRARLSGCSGRV